MSKRHWRVEGLRTRLVETLSRAVRDVVDDIRWRHVVAWRLPRIMPRFGGAPRFPRGWHSASATLRVEPLEQRMLLSTVTWVNSGGGGWATGSKWSTRNVSTGSDDAVRSVTGQPPLTITSR